MSTPNDGRRDPYEPRPNQRGTREPGEDVPRQQAPGREYGAQDPYGQDPYGQQGQQEAYGQQGPYGQQGAYGQRGAYDPYLQDGDPRLGYPGGTGPVSYLNGGGAGLGEAVGQGLRNLLTFRGRASRSAFWWFVLFTLIVQLAINLTVGRRTHGAGPAEGLGLISTLLTLAVSVRRLHDTDHSGWWWLIGLVPIVGWIVLLVFYLQPGTRGPNRFEVRY